MPVFLTTASVVTASTKEGDVHFATPANMSYLCTSQEDISMNVYKNKGVDSSVLNEVTMFIWDARLQGFGLPKASNFSEGKRLKGNSRHDIPAPPLGPKKGTYSCSTFHKKRGSF